MQFLEVDELKALNERERRLTLGRYAIEIGRGGIRQMSIRYGVSREVIRRGVREIQSGEAEINPDRIRGRGAGKKNFKQVHPELEKDILCIADRDAYEIDGQKYTGTSIRKMTEEFNSTHDYTVNRSVIHNVLRENGYTCSRSKKKKKEA